jgi:acyl-CoA synthetase (AMP-forming)/AMP-acid ligase II
VPELIDVSLVADPGRALAFTIADLLRHNGDTLGDKPVVVTPDDVLTHAALDERSRRLAGALVANGAGKSARVGLLAPNGVDWAVTAAAVLRIGAVLVPLSTLLRSPELSAQLAVADVTHLVVARELRGRSYLDEVEQIAPGALTAATTPRCSATLPSLRFVWPIDGLPTGSVHPDVVESLERAVRPSDDAVIMFTSGSRGSPKGVVHTHGGSLLATASGLESRCIGPDERLYIPMPFFWTGGFYGGLLSATVAGATLLTEAIPEPATTLALLEGKRATLFRGWPDQATRLAADPAFATTDLSALGPGSLPAVLPERIRPAPGARAVLFGMTETAGPYCGDRLDRDLPTDEFGSCGRPFPGLEVRVVDPDSGRECEPGTPGEFRLRGPRVMREIKGRLREATVDVDGFYPTGDLGTVDRDGFLWFHGRLDDMIKVKGATVFPSEVESALRAIPGVTEAYVTDADIHGQTAVAALVISPLSLAHILHEVAARLSSFKVPTLWLVHDSPQAVPLSATSKVDKPALQALLLREGELAPRTRA